MNAAPNNTPDPTEDKTGAKAERPVLSLAKRQTERAAEGLVKQIEQLDDTTLACRDLKHAWDVTGAAHYNAVKIEGGVRGARYFERRLKCLRCPVERSELYRAHPRWLERLSVYYIYPKRGYTLHDIPKGVNVTGMIRFEQFKRLTGG